MVSSDHAMEAERSFGEIDPAMDESDSLRIQILVCLKVCRVSGGSSVMSPMSEQLNTIVGDADFVGTFDEEGADGYGIWYRSLEHNWSRETSCFGYVLGINANRGDKKVKGRMN